MLGVDPGWRKWAFELLVAFAVLPKAPRPARLEADAGELERLWQKLLDQPGHNDDAAGHLALAAKDGFNMALLAAPEAALEGVPGLLARPGIDETARLLILTRAAQGHWQSGQRDRFEVLMDELSSRLDRLEGPDTALLAEARLFFHGFRGRALISDGRPDLAYEPLGLATEAGEDILGHGGSADLWAEAIIKQLDLAHASDNAVGGRRLAAETLASDSWDRVKDPVVLASFKWRRLALDLMGRDTPDDRTDAALDGLEEILSESMPTEPRWPAECGRIGRYHVRAAARLGRIERAERVLDQLESQERLEKSTIAVLRARIASVEYGPGTELSSVLEAAVRSRLAAFEEGGSQHMARGLLHFDSDAELVSLALESLVASDGSDGTLNALRLLTEVQAVGGLAKALGARAMSPQEIVELCPENGGLLVLTPGYDYDHGFLVDRRGATAFHINGASTTHGIRRSMGRALRRAIEGTDPMAREELSRLGSELSERMFDVASSDRIASWNAMTVVGLDAWGDVPFEFLSMGDKRIGESLALAFVPSLPIAQVLAKKAAQPIAEQPPGARPIALTIATNIGDQTRELFHGVERLGAGQMITEALMPEPLSAHASMLHDADATLEGWMTQLDDRPLATILVGHGVRTATGEQALLLWDGTQEGGLLTSEAVRTVHSPRLVVLGSCEAGRSLYLRGGDGADGLDAAFLVAGAVVVVSSNAPVPLGSATHQCNKVLDECGLGGATVSAALLAGRRAAPNDLGAWSMRALGHGQFRPWAVPFPASPPAAGGWPWRFLAPCFLVLAVIALASAAARRRTSASSNDSVRRDTPARETNR